MKTTIKLLIICTTCLVFASCGGTSSKKVADSSAKNEADSSAKNVTVEAPSISKSPKGTAKLAFNALKSINQTTVQDFSNNFVTIDDHKEFITLRRPYDELKEQFNEFIMAIEPNYKDILEEGKKFGIKWEEIKYSDFENEEFDNDGVKGADGKLIFKYEDRVFTVDVVSLYTKNGVKLTEVKWLSERT